METDDQPEAKAPKKASTAKPKELKVEIENFGGDNKTVNILSVVSGLFGMPPSRVEQMIGTGSVHIDSEKWNPENNFDIPVKDIEGKMIEITARPTSIKFTFNSEDINEYRKGVV